MLSRRHALAALLAAPAAALAQTAWPSRPVRIVVAYQAGGASDPVARALAERIAPALGQPVVVENKGGGGGTVGLDTVAKSGDGHTFGFASISPLALAPHVGKVPFDPARDLVPVVAVADSPVLLMATSATQARDLRELLAAARAAPGRVRWATSGQAALGHLMLEQLKAAAKVDLTHVPYRGGGQQITDALSGQFEVISVNASATVVQHVRAGKLRVLAVGAPGRLDAFPEAPTLAEAGFPAANLSSVFGLFAPGGTPPAVVERLNAEINKALAAPDLRAKLVAAEYVPTGGTAAAFARRIATESENTLKIVRSANIRVE